MELFLDLERGIRPKVCKGISGSVYMLCNTSISVSSYVMFSCKDSCMLCIRDRSAALLNLVHFVIHLITRNNFVLPAIYDLEDKHDCGPDIFLCLTVTNKNTIEKEVYWSNGPRRQSILCKSIFIPN